MLCSPIAHRPDHQSPQEHPQKDCGGQESRPTATATVAVFVFIAQQHLGPKERIAQNVRNAQNLRGVRGVGHPEGQDDAPVPPLKGQGTQGNVGAFDIAIVVASIVAACIVVASVNVAGFSGTAFVLERSGAGDEMVRRRGLDRGRRRWRRRESQSLAGLESGFQKFVQGSPSRRTTFVAVSKAIPVVAQFVAVAVAVAIAIAIAIVNAILVVVILILVIRDIGKGVGADALILVESHIHFVVVHARVEVCFLCENS